MVEIKGLAMPHVYFFTHSECLILSTTFQYVFSSVQGDYGDIYQMSRNISISNFDGRVIMTEIERSMLKYTYDNIHMDQFLVLMIILQSRCY